MKIEIDADSLADAQQLIAEREQGADEASNAGTLAPTLKYRMSDPYELNTARIEQVRQAAHARHCLASDDEIEIEIDDDSIVSEDEDGDGPWIQAWLFVPKDIVPHD